MVEQLTRLVLVGEPSKASSSVGSRSGCVKQLRLAIFTPSLSRTPPHADYSVRVYALEDNMAALEVVVCRMYFKSNFSFRYMGNPRFLD